MFDDVVDGLFDCEEEVVADFRAEMEGGEVGWNVKSAANAGSVTGPPCEC